MPAALTIFHSSASSSSTAILGTTDGTVTALKLDESVDARFVRGLAPVHCLAVFPSVDVGEKGSKPESPVLVVAGTGEGDVLFAILKADAASGSGSGAEDISIARLELPENALRGEGGDSAFAIFPIAAVAPFWPPGQATRSTSCLVLAASASGPGLGDTGAGALALLSVDVDQAVAAAKGADYRNHFIADMHNVPCVCETRMPTHCVTSCEILGRAWKATEEDSADHINACHETFAVLGLRGGRCAVVRITARRKSESEAFSYSMETVALRPCGRGLAYGAVDTTVVAVCPPTAPGYRLRFATATLSGTMAAFTLLPSRFMREKKERLTLRQDWSKDVSASLISATNLGQGWGFLAMEKEAFLAIEEASGENGEWTARFARLVRPCRRVAAFSGDARSSLVFVGFPSKGRDDDAGNRIVVSRWSVPDLSPCTLLRRAAFGPASAALESLLARLRRAKPNSSSSLKSNPEAAVASREHDHAAARSTASALVSWAAGTGSKELVAFRDELKQMIQRSWG